MYKIRAWLGNEIFASSPTSVTLGKVACDWVEVHRHIEQGFYEKAARLIQGDFCEGLIIWDCPDLNQWLDSVRVAFQRTVARVLEEPLHPAVREGIHKALSLPGAAAHWADSTNAKRSGNSCFVGRVTERRKLEAAWRHSKEGRIVTAVVTGEPGIGKTAVCRRTVKKTVLQGSRGLLTAGFEVQCNLPYGLCYQILDSVRRIVDETDVIIPPLVESFLSTIHSEQGRSAPPLISGGMNHRIAGVVHLALRHLSKASPITILVDDVQWADPASLTVLHYLAHCESDLPVFILFTARSDAVDVFYDDRWKVDVLITLRGLSFPESRSLIHELEPTIRDEIVFRDIHEISGGNPLLVHAYAAINQSPGLPLPPSVKQYFKREAARLPKHSQLIGAALAAVGGPVPSSQLAWLTGLNVESTDAGIEELVLQGLVNLDNHTGAVTLKHDSAGEAFLSNLAPVALATLHGRAARMLRDGGSAAAIVATQMKAAGDAKETSQYALEAARASLQLYAYREAEHFFRIAIATAAEPAMELHSRVGLANILLRQGRSNEAEVVLKQCTTTEQMTRKQQAMLEAHLLISQLAEVAPPSVPKLAFKRALVVEPLLSGSLAARLFAAIAGNAQQGLHRLVEECTKAAQKPIARITDPAEQIQLHVRFSAFRAINAVRSPDLEELDRLVDHSKAWPAAFAACLSDVALIRISLGDLKEAEKQCAEGLEVCEQYGFLDERLRILNNLGVCYLEQGRWEDARDQLQAVVRSSGAVAAKEITSALSNLLILEYERGEYRRAIEVGNAYLRERALQTRLRIGSLALLGLAYLKLGHVSKAKDCYRSIRDSSSYDAGWSNDVSYLELLTSRLTVFDGEPKRAEWRLKRKVDEFADRDFFCAARMKIEWIRLIASRSPECALSEGGKLRPSLVKANAAPLLESLDGVISRSCRC